MDKAKQTIEQGKHKAKEMMGKEDPHTVEHNDIVYPVHGHSGHMATHPANHGTTGSTASGTEAAATGATDGGHDMSGQQFGGTKMSPQVTPYTTTGVQHGSTGMQHEQTHAGKGVTMAQGHGQDEVMMGHAQDHLTGDNRTSHT